MHFLKYTLAYFSSFTLNLNSAYGVGNMDVFDSVVTQARCIHHDSPPLEATYYEISRSARLELPPGRYFITANVTVIAHIIAKKLGDEAVVSAALTDMDFEGDTVAFDKAGDFIKTMGLYVSAGSLGWQGRTISIQTIKELRRRSSIKLLVGVKKASSGSPIYKALCVTGPVWGETSVRAIRIGT